MLSSNHLISPVLSLEVILIAGDSHTLSYYLHDSEGDVEIASGTSLAQIIYSLAPPDYLLTHAQNQLQKISKAVNLNFVESFDPNLADISFYWDREIELNDSLGVTYGLTLLNYSQQPKREWFEIFFNGPQLNQYGSDFNSYVFNHELLHALGFEHTFDSSDGDFYLSTDPLQSATPEETTMSYRTPSSGIYPLIYRLQIIRHWLIFGVLENQHFKRFTVCTIVALILISLLVIYKKLIFLQVPHPLLNPLPLNLLMRESLTLLAPTLTKIFIVFMIRKHLGTSIVPISMREIF